ncbi:MAG: N-acetylmuramoyl-L-alanine amidase [Sphaerochaetaceae bacterium]|nr:N-acetylmuramoyl-L-alanine amidase [Sphaerochaetaceae bacterium]
MSRLFRIFFPLTVLVSCFLFPLGATDTSRANTVGPFAMPVGTVVLDAGHGGHDPGTSATWPFSGPMDEKDITLDLVKRIKGILSIEAPALNVVLTRSDDTYVSLQGRCDIAVATEPTIGTSAIFVSIHVNSAQTTTAGGFEFLIKPQSRIVQILGSDSPASAAARFARYSNSELSRQLNQQNLLLGQAMEQALCAAFPKTRNRGIKETDIYVLNNSRMPAVLVEVGFISNETDARNLASPSWRQEMARAIASAILTF